MAEFAIGRRRTNKKPLDVLGQPSTSMNITADVSQKQKEVAPTKLPAQILQARIVSTAHTRKPSYSFKTFYVDKLKKLQQTKKIPRDVLDVEPLPFLAAHQARNQRSFIHEQNRIALKKIAWEKMPAISQQKISPVKAPQSKVEWREPSPPRHFKIEKSLSRAKHISRVPQPSLEDLISSGLSDPMKIIELLKKNKKVGFFYLAPNAEATSNDYSCYNVKVVSFEEIDPNDYATISLTGVTRTYGGEVEFTKLPEWERQYKLYRKLLELPAFKLFRKRQAFYVWHKTVRRKLIKKFAHGLEKKLYLLNPILCTSLLKICSMRYDISLLCLFSIKKHHIYSMIEFRDEQLEWLAMITEKLVNFRSTVKDIAKNACSSVLLEAGFSSQGYKYDPESCLVSDRRFHTQVSSTLSTVLIDNLNDLYGEADPPAKMTFTEQANKKAKCISLTRYIRLIDFLICNSLHTVVTNSLTDLGENFITRVNMAPSEEKIYSWRRAVEPVKQGKNVPLQDEDSLDDMKDDKEMRRDTDVMEEEEKISEKSNSYSAETSSISIPALNVHQEDSRPLFVTELELDLSWMGFDPYLEEFHEVVDEIVVGFEEAVYSLDPLLSDPHFRSYTQPIINNRLEKKLCGEGPSLAAEIAGDTLFMFLVRNIKKTFSDAFDLAEIYRETLMHFQEIYDENESLDLANMTLPKNDVQFFTESLQRYNAQVDAANRVRVRRDIGLLVVDTTPFKKIFIPSPTRCLDILHSRLPALARSKMDAVISDIQEAEFQLEIVPESTQEYVASLNFLDTFSERVEEMSETCNNITDLYAIIDKYTILTPPEDRAVFQTLEPSVANVRIKLDRVITKRDEVLQKFQACLQQDVAVLHKGIKEVKQKSQDPYTLGVKSERFKVSNMIKDMLKETEELLYKSTQYRDYQRKFELEMSTFDELNEVKTELKLKQLLWNSISEWDNLSEEWHDKPLENLNPEQMNGEVLKYLKHSHHLEKGLPPNEIVPVLKKTVMDLKEKMPVIVNLLNPSFKLRHWQKIQEIVGHHLPQCVPQMKDRFLTLQDLNEWCVFDKADEIAEVSAQASGESSLESMLKSIEFAWKKAELVVLQYRDFKDVYILGGTDDVQMQLDDSRVTVATLASSRYIAPIKEKIEEWQRQLNLMNETLEAWLAFQRDWVYLEPVFTASDIQRQLPAEAKMFLKVDKVWKDIMRRVSKYPNALRACTHPGLLEQLQSSTAILEKVYNCLESYLESKRDGFPRFYFLSNDELIEILSQSKNPQAVQPHLRKCFDAISSLEFATASVSTMDGDKQEVQYTNDILAMVSPEGESVAFGKPVKARGNVEDWLSKVEEAMTSSLRRLCKLALNEYFEHEREEWCISHASQVILTVSQMVWCQESTMILEKIQEKDVTLHQLKSFEVELFLRLNKLAALVRTNLASLNRNILTALITVDVHARDVITDLVKMSVSSASSFEWLRQLRYYWDEELDDCVIKCAGSLYMYGYEYLGACPRLVITPLTDRCYLCLMGALRLNLGGAPAGPAGTGKTETTKDLAKALAKQCVVFNCSEGLDFKMMGRFFSGLAQSGAWCCFDEFNRIDIEVLSVIAQQLLTIRNAKVAGAMRFMFEGREIKLDRTCAAFITMNPGYAGRTELPDNLKALFRPMAMMVPDYKLIAEVILYSEGFESSKNLAQKMVQMYKLCSEQLSHQDHYDFGMRAVKSVLVMAGSLKRRSPNIREEIVLIRALRDSNLPKFLVQDANLFRAILSDLFPNMEIPAHDYGVFETTVKWSLEESRLQPVPQMVKKVIQLYETMAVRHGVMLVGPTGGGKTTVYEMLAKTLTELSKKGKNRSLYQPVKTTVLNPKSITMAELYGEADRLTLEWKDGLMGISVRAAVQDTSSDSKWIVCDGPVDALWIENMNTLLDDNKMLCLANSERIKLSDSMRMLFEVEDLSQASPATVSRCGMVYVDPHELGWRPYVFTWLNTTMQPMNADTREFLKHLFESHIDAGLKQLSHYTQVINQTSSSKVTTVCSLLHSLLIVGKDAPDLKENSSELRAAVSCTFAFSYIWGLGGNLNQDGMEKFDTFVRSQLEEILEVRLPSHADLFGFFVDLTTNRFETWDVAMTAFMYDREVPFFDVMVPTIDTARYTYLMQRLIAVNKAVLLTGETGVGKSLVAIALLRQLVKDDRCTSCIMHFSAQTSSLRTQELIEAKLDKKRGNVVGPPDDNYLVLFVDDLNMPKLDLYGSQPPVELLRQLIDYHGLYDRDKLVWKQFIDITVTAACAPPGGGRNPVTPRFIRHFSMFALPAPSEQNLKTIFSTILKGFLFDFPGNVKETRKSIVDTAVEIYRRMSTDLLPTPAKSHYVFNLRDLSKCIQGMLRASPSVIRKPDDIYRLFFHEALRVFHDRLISDEDKQYFYEILCDVSNKSFRLTLTPESFVSKPIVFGDFMSRGASKEDRVYTDYSENLDKVRATLESIQDEFNASSSTELHLVFFRDAIEHISRIIRMIVTPRGNALLVGVGGCGKQSLTRLACYVCGYQCFEIELTRNYNHNSFRDDLKKLYEMTGVSGQDTVFLFTDNQIILEEFLEDINNILNSGEVPNLFNKEEFEVILGGVRQVAGEYGVTETDRDGVILLFKSRVRERLHLVLSMSPVGDSFRSRCRMFPSIVNCCTIDWFVPWPEDALLSVSQTFFGRVEHLQKQEKKALSFSCVEIHTSVEKMATRFYKEFRRHYYITPTSYIGFITLYLRMLDDKKNELVALQDKFKTGLTKLFETYEVVDVMKAELDALEPELVKKSTEAEEILTTLMADQEKADQVREVVVKDQEIAEMKAIETQLIADDAQSDLNKALPLLHSANKALDSLDKSDIAELKVFSNPPDLVMTVMETICILLNSKTDWPSARLLLGDANFLKRLLDYDKDNVSQKTIKRLDKYIDDPNFQPDFVEKVSKACKSMCMWVRAMHTYSNVVRVVQPKKERYQAAKAELEATMADLKEKQSQLKEVEGHIAKLQKSYDDSSASKEELMQAMRLTTARMRRAKKLTAALSEEQVRWKEKTIEFEERLRNVLGDVFIGAACVTYYGAFTSHFREELVALWSLSCKERGLETSTNLTLLRTFGDSYEIRQWNSEGLPRDVVSTENAILVTRSWRWPLMIDPQDQANRWVRNMETKNGLKVIKLTTPNFLRTLESAIRLGFPVLLEGLGENLDPALDPILLKQTFQTSGRLLIRLGDKDVDYDEKFKLYMTTKLANPHYMPEVCVKDVIMGSFIKVTIINFTVTRLGLEDQILSDVVRLERPDLEEQRNDLIMRINSDKAQLKSIEDQILKLLHKTKGNILDNEVLINTLDESKMTSSVIGTRLDEAEDTEMNISRARDKYRSVAIRGSVMFFVVSSLAQIDPMYQFSLQYFNGIFNTTIANAPTANHLEKRLEILTNETTYAVYRNVSRGLFERHKLIFSFMLCIQILRQDELVSNDEWNYFLRGAAAVERKYPDKPEQATWLTAETWERVVDMEHHLKGFIGLSNDMTRTPIYCAMGELEIRLNPIDWKHYTVPEPPPLKSHTSIMDIKRPPELVRVGHWEERLTMFQKLLLVRFFMEEKLVSSITNFVLASSGKDFVENPPVSLASLYEDMSKDISLVFILSTGSDPMGAFSRFAKEKQLTDTVEAISLGQGQGPVAEKLLVHARDNGGWVFLQNCHLARSFMPHLELLYKQLSEDPNITVHEDFRLFLSSMPTEFFPVSILQSSVKVTNEPPKGLRANIRGAFASMTSSFFEDHSLGMNWRKMIFGICFFHAIIQERKKFGALGWNISYEFNDSDRECAFLNLDLFCKRNTIPWDALTYITGEITYGGRVTDAIDQRCLRTTLSRFFSEKTLEDNYKYSESGVYFSPCENTLAEFEEHINQLPINDDPEVFGMHNNANLAFQKQETHVLINTILEIQPRIVIGGEGESGDTIVSKLASKIYTKVQHFHFDVSKAEHKLFKLDAKGSNVSELYERLNSLTTVLEQEMERFNKLLHVLITSLKTLTKAIDGLVVMSEVMEKMYTSFLNNQVPQIWESAAYPSLKPLGSWVKDLMLRLNFMRSWLERGKPSSFWISGFFFPQGFLTGALQNHSRKYDLPIDQLSFHFHPLNAFRDQVAYDEELKDVGFEGKTRSDTKLPAIREGVMIHGLFTDAFRFDVNTMKMTSELDRVMNEKMPIIHMEPKMNFTPPEGDYLCPLYKTAARAGVLSTTGHSTNFVIFVHLPTAESPDFWVSRGSALLCSLDD